ncbi:MAG TPA: flagellar basal body protein [Bryobacteraceae bacterium]|nr:flagellar basal body protein [Bryobacteraceae bacterium]
MVRPLHYGPGMMLEKTGLELGNYLSYLSRREEVIASNIANADTPGYKTRDVAAPADFSSALQDATSSTTEALDLPTRNDGNNVAIDREAKLLAENSLKFNLATQMLRGEIKDIRSAIEEGRA